MAGRDDLIPAYLDALEGEMAAAVGPRTAVDTIFLGGGTPSHLSPQQLDRLLAIIDKHFELAEDGEFSCEANPLDCSPHRLQCLKAAGVNRISLGGQSFDDAKLKALERDHTEQQLAEALEMCASYVDNLSLDLIFAAPGESLEVWQSDVQRALASPIQHLSTYGLTIERGSAFYGRVLHDSLSELDSELQLSMYEHTLASLRAAGWDHYEVSNFARPGMRCRHNEAYWLGKLWWAFGPGAASFSISADGQSYVRAVNHRSTTTYIQRQLRGASIVAESELLTLEDYVRERLVFGLRRLDGVELDELEQIWGAPVQPLFEPYLGRYLQQGWLTLENGRLRLTPQGLVISDSLWPDLLSAD